MTTSTKTTATALHEMRAELRTLEQRADAVADELQGVAFQAERGDAASQQRRAELLGARSAAEHHMRELRDAIALGEPHLGREQREAIEAERQSWSAKADELRVAQRGAAKRLDVALAEIDAAWTAYVAATDERGNAMRRAGRTWSNVSWANTFLGRLLFKHTPRLARLLNQDPEYRKHAATAEDMVGR